MALVAISPTKATTSSTIVIAKIIATAIPIMSTFIITDFAIWKKVMQSCYSLCFIYFIAVINFSYLP